MWTLVNINSYFQINRFNVLAEIFLMPFGKQVFNNKRLKDLLIIIHEGVYPMPMQVKE